MPRGYVKCRYVGGPWDGKTEELPAIYCRKSMGVRDEFWIAEDGQGGAVVYRGAIGADWTLMRLHHYIKDEGRGVSGETLYRFITTSDVHRCNMTTAKGNRCSREAMEGKLRCKQHEKRLPT